VARDWPHGDIVYVLDPSRDPRDETEGAGEFYFLWLSGSAAIAMSLGSMATGVSREWMCTPAKTRARMAS
jgi:hypothetical protein